MRSLDFLARPALFVACLAAVGTAQSVLVVDAANAPGTDFTSLPAAVASASDGDVLIVRPGGYFSFETQKGITVLAEPGARIVQSVNLINPLVRVHDLPAGHTFVLRGLSLSLGLGTSHRLVVDRCAGLVLLESVDAEGPPSNASGIRVVDSSDVRIQDCRTGGMPAIDVIRSSVVLTDTESRGSSSVVFTAGAGLRVQDGRAIVSRGSLRGGDAVAPQSSAVPGPGLELANATVTLTGDASTIVAAGGNHAQPVSAITGSSGNLRLHSAVQIVPNAGAPGIAATVSTAIVDVPSLRAIGAGLGGTVHVELFARAGSVEALVLGIPGPLVPLQGLGDLGFDPLGPMIALAPGFVPPSRVVSLSATVPNVASLLGARFTWQAIDVAVPASFLLSNPATYSIGM